MADVRDTDAAPVCTWRLTCASAKFDNAKFDSLPGRCHLHGPAAVGERLVVTGTIWSASHRRNDKSPFPDSTCGG